MYYTYVARSLKDGSYYKGYCEHLDKRLEQHNSGMTKSIRHLLPFEIIYFEEFNILEESIKREKYFKTAAGGRYLKKKLAS